VRGLGQKLGALPEDLILGVRTLGLLGGISQRPDPALNVLPIFVRYAAAGGPPARPG
jgi:hypothetical protein